MKICIGNRETGGKLILKLCRASRGKQEFVIVQKEGGSPYFGRGSRIAYYVIIETTRSVARSIYEQVREAGPFSSINEAHEALSASIRTHTKQ